MQYRNTQSLFGYNVGLTRREIRSGESDLSKAEGDESPRLFEPLLFRARAEEPQATCASFWLAREPGFRQR